MKSRVLTLSLGIAAILLAAQQLSAQTARRCLDRQIMVDQLASKYGETRQSIGLSGADQVVEVFASLKTGTWTITVTSPSGQACLVAAGRGYEPLTKELTPAMQGTPA